MICQRRSERTLDTVMVEVTSEYLKLKFALSGRARRASLNRVETLGVCQKKRLLV